LRKYEDCDACLLENPQNTMYVRYDP